MKNKLKNTLGITLIALIVTIVVLLIISGISISLVLGKNGIVTKANYASNKYKDESLKDLSMQTDINYEESLQSIENPDRGFYFPCGISYDNGFYSTDKEQSINNTINYAKSNNSSLLHLRIDIHDLGDGDLSNDDINGLNRLMDLLRNKNMKCIVRFSYDKNYDTQLKEPDDFSIIVKHIGQLKKYFTDNRDLITVVEAGFIGPWGEMHSSKYASTPYYNQLIDALLKSVPSDIQVSVRTLAMYKNRFGDQTSDDSKRIGYFDDGYMGSYSDLGSFNASTAEQRLKQYQEYNEFNKYRLYGGEVTNGTDEAASISNIDNAATEMFLSHTAYLNYEHNYNITNGTWKEQIYNGTNEKYNGQKAYKYISDHLGYRLVLKNSQLNGLVDQGGELMLSFDVENTGFGNITNKQDVKIILQKGDKTIEANTSIDANKWLSQTTTNNFDVLSIPKDMETGEWNIFVKVQRYNSAIEFANDDLWNNSISANYMGKVKINEKDDAKATEFKELYYMQ